MLSSGGVPVAGVARSGIDSTALVEGRAATVVGIVKRAYPTASDQRFALVPRSTADIRLGAATGDGPDGSGNPSSGDGPGTTPWPSGAVPTGSYDPAQSGGPSSTTTVALADLAAHDGQRVLAGGSVTNVDGARLTIDDGSAAAVVRLVGEAESVADDRAAR